MTGEQTALGGFDGRRRRGPTETAAERTIKAWRDDGHTVDPLTSSQLRGAAADVDDAERDYRAGTGSKFTATRARSLLLDLYRVHAPRDAAAAAGDPFAALVEQLAEQDA